jgi:hypothetical protein
MDRPLGEVGHCFWQTAGSSLVTVVAESARAALAKTVFRLYEMSLMREGARDLGAVPD